MKIKVNQYNICHNGIVYKKGEVFEVSSKDYNGFLKKYCSVVEEKKPVPVEETPKKERAKKS